MLKKFLLSFVILLQGCSVYMAAEGTKSPDLSSFKNGMSRFQVESILGSPISYTTMAEGSKAVYEYETGNDPDSGRASLWLAADIVLVFLPEIVGTPYEMSRGETRKILVIYDNSDNVVKFQS